LQKSADKCFIVIFTPTILLSSLTNEIRAYSEGLI